MILDILYIDPGAGSYLIQMIIASILGVIFFFRNIKITILKWFGMAEKEEETDE
ncbi:MAG: hypothetical protein IH946_01365 [Bacteroidetes bacterium]|nr:hypothetical protein [Bacteroidota bacterium]